MGATEILGWRSLRYPDDYAESRNRFQRKASTATASATANTAKSTSASSYNEIVSATTTAATGGSRAATLLPPPSSHYRYPGAAGASVTGAGSSPAPNTETASASTSPTGLLAGPVLLSAQQQQTFPASFFIRQAKRLVSPSTTTATTTATTTSASYSTISSFSSSASSSFPLTSSPPSATSVSSSSPPARRRRASRHSATMPEYRHVRGASLSISGSAAATSGRGGNSPAGGIPRSPPNTSHVPCKFYRQGACQAGNACPFSHELGTAAETICKYFAKGNCKFGPKCANMHVLPDGRRVNYGKNGFTIITAAGGGDHSSPTSAAFAGASQSALTSSLFHNDQAYLNDDRGLLAHHSGLGIEDGNPGESPYSLPSSTYGSPREGFAFSPMNAKGLSILDVPLPASFDSNGISNAARFPAAPWPSSVPSKFGLESPAASLSNAKDARTSETLKLLHNSAFGSSDNMPSVIGSPPNSQLAIGDEYFGKRAMHSSRYAKPKMLSSSVPKTGVDRDWEAGFDFGEDDGENVPENYLPENLQDLLTPAEKARRGSMRGENDVGSDIFTTKYGSPMGTSPSRWGPLFQRQKEEEELSRSARNAGSAFGHVGSPLRNSTLAQEMGEGGFASSLGSNRVLASRTGVDPMSVLSQQFQNSHLDGASPHLHPSSARGPMVSPIGKDRSGMERHVSSGSLTSTMAGRFTTPIDEEDPAFVFSMEEEDEPSARIRKRASAGLGMSGLTSYAGAVSSKPSAEGSKDTKTGPNGR